MSVTTISNKLNISAIDIKPNYNIKLKLNKKDKPQKLNNISSYKHKKTIKLQKNLSSILFQNNDVDMVRSLNPDSDKDLCENLLFKEHLINNKGTNDNFDIPEQLMGQKISLPKIKRITISGILESEKKLNRNKKEAQRNIANNQLEKELYHELREIRNKYNEKKKKKNQLYNNYVFIMKQINDINLDLKIIELRYTDNYLSKIYEMKTKELEMQRIQREKMENDDKFNQKVINTLKTKNSNLDEGLDMKKINEEMNINNTIESNTNESKQNIKSNTIENRLKRYKTMFLAKKEQDEIKLEKIQKIKSLKEELKQLDDEIKILNKELIELREKDNKVVQELMKHFQALLFNGRDTRNEGLIWIIKAIWNLGKNVPMNFIPTFLDFKSIEFLFKLANKSIELDNKKKLLNQQKKDLNIKLHKLYFCNDKVNNKSQKNLYSKKLFGEDNRINNRRSSLIFKTNLLKRNSVLKNSINDSIFVKSYIHSHVDDEEQNEKDPNTFKEISMTVNKNTKNYEIEKLSEMEDIKNLQTKLKEIELEIDNLKNQEIKRIFKEFIVNDYQNKYHVSVDIVLAALLGEHCKNIEINKYAKFKREYFEAIKNLRFYEYGKNKDSNI